MAVHVGVRGPGHLSRVFGWTPQQLGSSLLGYWDAENPSSLTLSGTSVTTWTDLVGSYAATQAISGSKPRYDANAFGGVLNSLLRSQEFDNAAWTKLGCTISANAAAGVDGAMTADQIVEDTANNTHAVNQPIASTGVPRVVYYDVKPNGRTWVAMQIGSLICYYNLAGAGALGTNQLDSAGITALANGFYRVWGYSAAPSSGTCQLLAATANGTVIYTGDGASGVFVDWGQAQINATTPGQRVLTTSAAAYGFGRPGVIFDGSDDELTYAGVGAFPVAAAGGEIWGLVDQQALAADATARRILSYGGIASTDNRFIARDVSGGVNRAFVSVGDGALQKVARNTTVDVSGRHLVRGIVSPTDTTVYVDGGDTATQPAVPATGTTRTRLGASTGATASGFWQGIHSTVLITGPLTTPQAAQLTAYLKARGGIA